MTDGGYDRAYELCPTVWGETPGSLLLILADELGITPSSVLDLGCGQGKNARFLANQGAVVTAIDCSEAALRHVGSDPIDQNICYLLQDVRDLDWEGFRGYDAVVLYGLLHCLESSDAIRSLVSQAQASTVAGGTNILCSFNDRHHRNFEEAHRGFCPTLLPHSTYLDMYSKWDIVLESDTDLHERHPDTEIDHTHSMTRIVARKR